MSAGGAPESACRNTAAPAPLPLDCCRYTPAQRRGNATAQVRMSAGKAQQQLRGFGAACHLAGPHML